MNSYTVRCEITSAGIDSSAPRQRCDQARNLADDRALHIKARDKEPGNCEKGHAPATIEYPRHRNRRTTETALVKEPKEEAMDLYLYALCH